jgi:tetrapyrrole methylase family protein / MazG family protein
MTKLTPPPVATPGESAGDRFERLVQLMRTLRSPDGCSWDRKQTLETLRPFVLEEAYEVVAAIDGGDPTALCDEVGDLLLEAVFVAQISADQDDFTIADAVDAINAKLVRRHPHVFGEAGAADGPPLSPTEVKAQWEQIKTQERAGQPSRKTLLDGIPESLPALLRAARIGARTANVGFDWDEAGEVLTKVDEEMAELKEAMADADQAHVEEELGDLLFTVANLARKLQIDPESALRAANNKFTGRFRRVEQRLTQAGRSLHDATAEELEREWQVVKRTPGAHS